MSHRLAFAIFLAAVLFGQNGCRNNASNARDDYNRQAEIQGSPFRLNYRGDIGGGGGVFTTVMIDLPTGATKAQPVIKQEIWDRIEGIEAAGNDPPRKLLEIRLLPDGREVWVLEKDSSWGVAYIVTLRKSTNGNEPLEVDGPHLFSRHG
jgi:hypothetical protein